jgi:putative nucleotidyltransferase with HDIG domain
MTTQLRSSELAIVAGALGLGLYGSIALEIHDLQRFIAFAILIASSELFEVTLPNEARYPLGLAPALGLALMGPILPAAGGPPATAVLIAFTLGMGIATGVRALLQRDLMIVETASRLIVLAAGTAVYAAIRTIPGLPLFDVERSAASTDISIIGFLAMFTTILLLSALMHALCTAQRKRISPLPILVGTLGSTLALHLSLISVGALLAVAYPALRYWAFPLFLAPLAATQFAFRQFASIRRTYLQTIRALSKVPEMAGYTHPGHSTRVAELSVAIARELGMSEKDIDQIEYAALLHDIGRVSIPDPAQATSSGSMELAIVGAAIVRETGHFPLVAEMIEHQHDPYRRRGETAPSAVPIGARIIKVASAYDDHTRPGGIGESPVDAIERLSAAMATDYDPDVVGALGRVLDKRGVL